MDLWMKDFADQPRNVKEILLSDSKMHLYPAFAALVWRFLAHQPDTSGMDTPFLEESK